MKCSTPGLTKFSAEHNIINAWGDTDFAHNATSPCPLHQQKATGHCAGICEADETPPNAM
jgi:hypothetical protein